MKQTLMSLFISAFAASLQAQEAGFKAGIGHTLFKTDHPQSKSFIDFSYSVGSFYRFYFSKGFYLQTEILISEINFKTRNSSLDPDFLTPIIRVRKSSSLYVDVPILLVKKNNLRTCTLRFLIGPAIALALREKSKVDFFTIDPRTGQQVLTTFSFVDSEAKPGYSLQCGLGLDIKKINLDLRYQLSPLFIQLKDRFHILQFSFAYILYNRQRAKQHKNSSEE